MEESRHRFFAADGAALRTIRSALAGATEVRIATAYFAASGYQALQDVLQGKRVRLLIGRPEGGEDRLRDVLTEFMNELSYGPQEGRTRAMRQLLDALQHGWMAVTVGESPGEEAPWLKAGYLYHHAKLYIADQRAAVVTSANFSYHGLCLSREAGYVVTDPGDVEFFVERFDHYFAQAVSITQDLIEALRRWLEEYDPYTIYARALLELYGLPEEAVPSQLPPLAEYQKGVASSILRSILEHNGAFLIASTGLGKTVIASHVAAYLRMRDEIRTVLVVCPAGMREVWSRSMRAARLSSAEFSYHTLARREGDSSLPRLEHELRLADEETLIILDESHRLRNEATEEGDLRLSHQRIREAVRERRSKVLLLTATPYSKGIQDVRSQLALLPPPTLLPTPLGMSVPAKKWTAGKLSELPDLPPCTVLNIPDVVRHFSEQDEAGERFIRFGEKKLYFPRRIRLITVRYPNPYDDLLAELLKSGLLYQAVKREEKVRGKRRQKSGKSALQPTLFEDEEFCIGKRIPMQEALFLHQFCSSPARVKETCQKLETGDYEYQFARQAELTAFLSQHWEEIERGYGHKRDVKLRRLAEIIQDAGERKVVVFCEYKATARYVAEELKHLLPRRIRVETTVDKRGQALDEVLRCFAPEANEVLPEERNPQAEIHVLVASRAVSEGFNLQDASVLVNYDLPWTVLELAQRMGRILRPWREPRDIFIYNLVPSTMENQEISHALRWKERLGERSREHSSLAQIPVLIYDESQREKWEREFEMIALGRELYLARETEADLNLDEVIDFVSRTDELRTSTFYKDLIEIRDKAEIRSLPLGIRSAMESPRRKRLLFLLLRRQRHLDTVIADWRGEPLPESFRRDEVMRLIRCLPDTPKAPFDRYPDDDEFDAWIERARKRWAEQHSISPSRLQIVCTLALV